MEKSQDDEIVENTAKDRWGRLLVSERENLPEDYAYPWRGWIASMAEALAVLSHDAELAEFVVIATVSEVNSSAAIRSSAINPQYLDCPTLDVDEWIKACAYRVEPVCKDFFL